MVSWDKFVIFLFFKNLILMIQKITSLIVKMHPLLDQNWNEWLVQNNIANEDPFHQSEWIQNYIKEYFQCIHFMQ